MRARTVCSIAGCPRLAVRRGRCELHAPAPWAGSRARRELLGLALSSAARARVRRRAGYRCAQCGKAVAKGTGAVDHVLAGDPNSELQLLCDDCDRAKTLADLLAMRRRRLR